MTKKDFISSVAEASGLTQKDASAAVDAFVKAVSSALAKGESVQLVGFGTFSVAEKSERTSRNPRTGEQIKIAACKAPKFKAGKALKDAVNA